MSDSRREVKSRGKNIFHKLSRALIKVGLMPNHISVASVLFAGLGAYGFYAMSVGCFWTGVVLALLGIQLRLVCNLIDGLMAVEGKLSSPQGELYNDVPDRFSDWLLIVSCGFVVSTLPYGWELAWVATVFAILTAYVRVLGASQGVGHDFGGPMAKQHRMAILNLGIVGLVVEQVFFNKTQWSLYFVLIIIGLGSLLTVIFRLKRISVSLQSK